VLRKDPTTNFRDVDLCVMLVTALVHDLEHPGTTNSYQVNSGSTLALRYSDISVCEYHHAALTSQMLAQPETAIFANLEPSTQRQIRKTMISLILSTDNTQHFNLKRELEAINSKRDQKQPTASSSDPERDRLTIMKCVLHAADISNPAKPWALARKWSDLILEEFYLQGDKEREKGLEISLNCDRYTVFQDEMSCKFIDIIVFPFFDELCDLLPETFFMIACIKNNRKMWHELLVSRIAKQDPIGNAAQIVSCNEKWTVFASECDTTTKFAEEIVRKKATAP
jgi:cAMP-specific phosphodiesterase 4